MNKNKRGFTLVELIVVIVVLGILSTLGFISYSGYSKDARNSKRKTDISNLTTQLELRKIEGEDLFSFVLDDTSTITNNIQISGYSGLAQLGSRYKAGNADYVYLELVGENFADPLTGDSYKVGVTSYQDRYEVASAIEGEPEHTSYIDGTWLPRTTAGTKIARDKIIGDTFYFSGATKSDALLYRNDVVRVGSGNTDTYTIKRIYNDRLVVDRSIVNTGGDNIFLNIDETRHLIKKWDADWAISRSGSTHTPYNLDN